MAESHFRTKFLTGVAVVVPLIVSAWALITVARFVANTLSPIAVILRDYGIQSGQTVILLQGASVLLLILVIYLIGVIAQRQIGRRVVSRIDVFLGQIPGLGSVYQTARRMSDLILDPEDDGNVQFREVKLVEFPAQNTYTLGFLTSDEPPDSVVTAAQTIVEQPDAAYQTLFLPMAPNPVMGGHLTHVPTDRVHDVDMSIEDAIQYILTTGVVDGSAES